MARVEWEAADTPPGSGRSSGRATERYGTVAIAGGAAAGGATPGLLLHDLEHDAWTALPAPVADVDARFSGADLDFLLAGVELRPGDAGSVALDDVDPQARTITRRVPVPSRATPWRPGWWPTTASGCW